MYLSGKNYFEDKGRVNMSFKYPTDRCASSRIRSRSYTVNIAQSIGIFKGF